MNDLQLKEPVLVVGIGGAGSRIAKLAAGNLECRSIVVSSDRKDFDGCDSVLGINSSGWLNPSVYRLRAFAQGQSSEILDSLRGYSTVVIVANLAGRTGCAVAPVIAGLAKTLGATVVSITIMPFRFEKDRIFAAGTAFRRLREACDSVVVMDNDAFYESNPELSKQECYSLTNRAITDVLRSLVSGSVRPDVNVLCTSKAGADSESSLRESVAMLYRDVPDPGAITRAIMYVMGGDKLPLKELGSVVGHVQGMFNLKRSAQVAVESSSSADGVRVHLMASGQQKTRFDSYDPLGEIFADNTLDWDEPESASEIALAIPSIE